MIKINVPAGTMYERFIYSQSPHKIELETRYVERDEIIEVFEPEDMAKLPRIVPFWTMIIFPDKILLEYYEQVQYSHLPKEVLTHRIRVNRD